MNKPKLNKIIAITFIAFLFFTGLLSSNDCIAMTCCVHQTEQRSMYCAGHQCFPLINSAIFAFDNLLRNSYFSLPEARHANPYRAPLNKPPSICSA